MYTWSPVPSSACSCFLRSMREMEEARSRSYFVTVGKGLEDAEEIKEKFGVVETQTVTGKIFFALPSSYDASSVSLLSLKSVERLFVSVLVTSPRTLGRSLTLFIF